jgi:putative hydrolase of the HAD superfamily
VKIYKHIFFDLDRTLWDYERNSRETIGEILDDLQLGENRPDTEEFAGNFSKINNELWDLYRMNQIDKEKLRFERFHQTLLLCGIDDKELSARAAAAYIAISPEKNHLVPGAVEVLEYLSSKYPLHIITNGFDESQRRKLKFSGIEKYFKLVVTSESSNYRKPDKRIFDLALKLAKGMKRRSVMIGDSYELDIKGALNAGLDSVYFIQKEREGESSTYEIHELKQLIGIL